VSLGRVVVILASLLFYGLYYTVVYGGYLLDTVGYESWLPVTGSISISVFSCVSASNGDSILGLLDPITITRIRL
jgi:hypothetical protein